MRGSELAEKIALYAANRIITADLWSPDKLPKSAKQPWWKRLLIRRRNHHGIPEFVLDTVVSQERYQCIVNQCFGTILDIIRDEADTILKEDEADG